MRIYISPNCIMGVDDFRLAWEACPADCTPLVVGDLNIRFEDPADNRADAIVRGSGGKNMIFSNGPNSTSECSKLLY
jgi:hypothetical protein